MTELVEVIVKALVENKDAVKVREEKKDGDDTDYIYIEVAKEDMGRIIGKEGKIAKSIRTIVRASATKQGKNVRVDIVE